MALDERLRREIERAARPADPSGVYEELIRRRERRRIVRHRVEAGALALVVFAATIGGFFALTRVFRQPEEPPPIAAPSVSNGLIVFSLPLESGGEHVFGVAPDGTGLRQLTPEGDAVYRSPDVSPDGSTVVVVVHETDGFEPGRSVLATVPITGGSPTWLFDEPAVVLDPAWSPDGTRIAFAGSPGGPFGIYVLDLRNGGFELVPGTDEISVGDPTWSPDGTRIAFEATDTNPERWDIYSVRLDGSELTNLTNTPDESETWPAWSWASTGSRSSGTDPRRADAHRWRRTGRTKYRVSGEFVPSSPAWSPTAPCSRFRGHGAGLHGSSRRHRPPARDRCARRTRMAGTPRRQHDPADRTDANAVARSRAAGHRARLPGLQRHVRHRPLRGPEHHRHRVRRDEDGRRGRMPGRDGCVQRGRGGLRRRMAWPTCPMARSCARTRPASRGRRPTSTATGRTSCSCRTWRSRSPG